MLKSTSKCDFPLASPHLPVEVRILVQGFRESPDVVATLIDQTVKNLTQSFHQMSPKEFEVRKAPYEDGLLVVEGGWQRS